MPPGIHGLCAAAAVAPTGREAPAPQRIRMSQGGPPNAPQQWAEAYTVAGHKVLKDGLPLEDAWGEKYKERTAELRRPHLSNAQRPAARVERCLHQKRAVHQAARALQDSKPVDARDLGVHASLHVAHPGAASAAPLEAAEPTSQLTREQLQEMVGTVSAHHQRTAAGPSRWTFQKICAAWQSSDAALNVTLVLVNLILSGELSREAFLLDGLLIARSRSQEAACGPSRSARCGIALQGSARCGRTGGASAHECTRCKRQWG